MGGLEVRWQGRREKGSVIKGGCAAYEVDNDFGRKWHARESFLLVFKNKMLTKRHVVYKSVMTSNSSKCHSPPPSITETPFATIEYVLCCQTFDFLQPLRIFIHILITRHPEHFWSRSAIIPYHWRNRIRFLQKTVFLRISKQKKNKKWSVYHLFLSCWPTNRTVFYNEELQMLTWLIFRGTYLHREINGTHDVSKMRQSS